MRRTVFALIAAAVATVIACAAPKTEDATSADSAAEGMATAKPAPSSSVNPSQRPSPTRASESAKKGSLPAADAERDSAGQPVYELDSTGRLTRIKR